jgi:Arc/MetJ-type ribon-helix-helix transcriptional regulator
MKTIQDQEIEENFVLMSFRIYPSILKRINKILKKDQDGIYNNKCHFIRSAVSYYVTMIEKNKRIKKW